MHACQAVVNFKTLFSICFLLSFSFMITCGWGGGYFTTQVSDDKKQIYNPGKKKCLNGLLFICENCISLTSGQCCEMPKCSTVCQNVGNIEWWGEGKVNTFGYVFVIHQTTIHVISMLVKITHTNIVHWTKVFQGVFSMIVGVGFSIHHLFMKWYLDVNIWPCYRNQT